MRSQRFAVTLALLGMVISFSACHSQPPIPEQRYNVSGKVLAVDKNQGTVTVAEDNIPGYMSAMTMSYPLKDNWAFNILKPGQTIHGTLVVASDRASLEGISVTEDTGSQGASLAGSAVSPVGKEVPDFSLTNQDGRRIHLKQYRGKALLLTFIYTRCPFPNYCPLMSKNFAEILKKVSGDPGLSPSTRLLSISIDPEYDKPAVLRAYGLNVAGDPHPFGRWEFASGTPEQVRKIAEFFGLKYWTEGGQIVHALVTASIGPDGKVVKVYPGNDWQTADVLSDLRSLVSVNR